MTADTQSTPRAALDAGIDAARLANPQLFFSDGRNFVMLPEGYRLHETTDPDRLPSRIKQHVVVDDLDSLTAYANRFSDARSILIADEDRGRITAHLDWHRDNNTGTEVGNLEAQAAQHSVDLILRDSLEFARWNAMEAGPKGDKMHGQEEFARFIEENIADLDDPDPSTMLSICRDLEVSSGHAFKSGVRLENGDRSFKYETDTKVMSEIQVPTEIGLSIPLYFGEQPTEVRAKFRFRANAGGLFLGFVWHRVEYKRRAVFREMAFKAAEETGLPVYFGRP